MKVILTECGLLSILNVSLTKLMDHDQPVSLGAVLAGSLAWVPVCVSIFPFLGQNGSQYHGLSILLYVIFLLS